VFVAPHGGRRDPARHPWTRGGLRTNDLCTAELTHELAIATAGSALVNASLDRNDADLNRITMAHDRAPTFLEALAELLETSLDRCGHAVVLTIHGWNVVQAMVDVGIGYRPGHHAPGAAPGPTASPEFVADALGPLIDALGTRGITTALGVRYPARGRENLLQLFTARYLDDPRPLVRRLAKLGQRCDGVQLELGLPLRWPGPWRTHLVRAVVDTLPALLKPPRPRRVPHTVLPEPSPGPRRSLEFVSADLSGLAALDPAGGRFLLFEPDGTLLLFTGERVGGERDGHVGPLALGSAPDGAYHLRYDGPLLRFPDTTPFVDLEQGLATATLIEAAFAADYRPAHAGCPFGTIDGTLTLDAGRRVVRGTAAIDRGDPRQAVLHHLALDLGSGERLLLDQDGESCTGFLCRDGTHVAIAEAAVAGERIRLVLATGERRVLHLVPVHRLPVVRGGSVPPVQVEFTACRLATSLAPGGWRFSRASPPAPPAA
jgi:hypothetical protein